jgi:hypothetical protein
MTERLKPSDGARAIYNPFTTGSDKASEYDAWSVLRDAGKDDEADEIFKRHNSGMTYAERNG